MVARADRIPWIRAVVASSAVPRILSGGVWIDTVNHECGQQWSRQRPKVDKGSGESVDACRPEMHALKHVPLAQGA